MIFATYSSPNEDISKSHVTVNYRHVACIKDSNCLHQEVILFLNNVYSLIFEVNDLQLTYEYNN